MPKLTIARAYKSHDGCNVIGSGHIPKVATIDEQVVSFPDPTHKTGKGLVTLLAFLGCADSAIT